MCYYSDEYTTRHAYLIAEMNTRNNTAAQNDLGRSEWIDALSYAQRQRLHFFEARLLWEGQVNRQDVCGQFGVTANHFTREVRDYKKHFPDNVSYDVSARAYRPTGQFKAGFATGEPEEYLGLLRLYTEKPSASLMAELGTTVPSTVLPEPESPVDQYVFRVILSAIHDKYGCEILYQSFSKTGPSKRIVWPHALAFAGLSWYVRAYDSLRERYINLALSRITSANLKKESIPEAAEVDLDWEQTETIEVTPNPKLPISLQRIIAKEYGMKKQKGGFVWNVMLKRCLIPYFLSQHRLDENRKGETPAGVPIQRIIVRNTKIVEQYAFPKIN